jgi:Holliday junction DNA helicase RuvA
MIGRLEGRLHRVDPGTVLIDVGGVGYLVSTTLRAFQALAGRDEAVLWIHTQVRDDAIVLFGFTDREELEAFSSLTSSKLQILLVSNGHQVSAARPPSGFSSS